MGFSSRFSRVVTKVLLVIGGLALMVMMAIVVGNSLGRALFRMPIFGTIEIAGLAGVAVVAVAVGFAEREGSNIVVDVVATRLAPRTRALTDAFTLLLSAGAIAFMFWAAVSDAFDSLTVRETTLTTGVLAAPFKLAWAVGVAILWLFLVQHMIEAMRKRRKG